MKPAHERTEHFQPNPTRLKHEPIKAMSPFPRLIVLFAAAGLSTGWIAKRAVSHQADPTEPTIAATQESNSVIAKNNESDRNNAMIPQVASAPRSTDTMETLLALGHRELAPRLALWLTDASEADIAEFWKLHSENQKPQDVSERIATLIFIHWTRFSLDNALATGGRKWRDRVLRAWVCADPQAALPFVLAMKPSHSGDFRSIMMGFEESHADWLVENLDEIPEEFLKSYNVGSKLASKLNRQSRMETELLLSDFPTASVAKQLAMEDPQLAIEQMRQQLISDEVTRISRKVRDSKEMAAMIEGLMKKDLREIERLIAQTPSGPIKLALESAMFEKLVESNPAAAIQQAEATTAPYISAERYATIGKAMIESDREQALNMAKNILDRVPDPFSTDDTFNYPGGSIKRKFEIQGVREFLGALVTREPEKVMQLFTEASDGGQVSDSFSECMHVWSKHDLKGFVNWTNRQTAPAIMEQSMSTVIESLRRLGAHDEANEWKEALENSRAR